MAFGRSNSLSINTGATNSLLPQELHENDPFQNPLHCETMPTVGHFQPRKHTRRAGYSELDVDVAFAPMPDSIANNGFNLAPSSNNNTNTNMSNIPPSTSGPSYNNPPPNASGAGTGSVFGGGLFPSDNTRKKEPAQKDQDTVNSFFGARLAAQRNNNDSNGNSAGNGPTLTNNSSQQQQQNQPPSNTGLFGSSTTQPANQTTGGGGLFGSTPQQSQPQQSGGLFGGANTQQPAGGLFGGANTQQSQPQQGGGLFGNANTQQNQGGNAGGSLFGGANAQQQNQPSGLGGSLFGGGVNAQPAGAGGLFGGGGNAQQTASNPGKSVFAGAGSGLGNSSTLGAGINMFAKPAQPASAGNLFASTANPPGQSQPSLLGATQHSRLNQSAPFGRLSMGQSTAPANTAGAVKVDLDTMRSTTRFDDCVDQVKDQLEQIDKMIQQQEHYCKQIEAICPKHGADVDSIAPDVDFVKSKADDVEQALISDAYAVDAQKRNTAKDINDVDRCRRIVTNLSLPQPYHVSGGIGGLGGMYGSQQRPQQNASVPDGEDPSNYDMDLIGNYFVPMAGELQKTINDYAKTLTEIESHMRVMESSAIVQAQQLAQQKSGMGGSGGQSSEDTVRDLADTLRGFEQSILGVAGVVGECREGVNELVLGRLGGFP